MNNAFPFGCQASFDLWPLFGDACDAPNFPGCSALGNSGSCSNGRAPYYSNPSGRGVCTCGGTVCPVGKLCTANKVCLVEPGFPCLAPADCTSGNCVNGLCA